jgi:hypothetical protein
MLTEILKKPELLKAGSMVREPSAEIHVIVFPAFAMKPSRKS